MSPEPVIIKDIFDAATVNGKKVRLKNGVLVQLRVESSGRGPSIAAVEVEDPVCGVPDEYRGRQPGKLWGFFEEADLFYTYRSQLL